MIKYLKNDEKCMKFAKKTDNYQKVENILFLPNNSLLFRINILFWSYIIINNNYDYIIV